MKNKKIWFLLWDQECSVFYKRREVIDASQNLDNGKAYTITANTYVDGFYPIKSEIVVKGVRA
jgi:hypothetical protein